ncbi:hypothetical protein OsI_37426 [Oryza sativa Indica Group]|uniref:F-box/LRR-repeat protein 15/At3g58940/PEG3-like LRR domain-containing protein n=1 Tax=Oryza sativa subsp. indica TaxID=39946 RepID=B8BM00_ORYSI|nr:hypothetical protein OsI_37426 [Oryza sativa Indica Group]
MADDVSKRCSPEEEVIADILFALPRGPRPVLLRRRGEINRTGGDSTRDGDSAEKSRTGRGHEIRGRAGGVEAEAARGGYSREDLATKGGSVGSRDGGGEAFQSKREGALRYRCTIEDLSTSKGPGGGGGYDYELVGRGGVAAAERDTRCRYSVQDLSTVGKSGGMYDGGNGPGFKEGAQETVDCVQGFKTHPELGLPANDSGTDTETVDVSVSEELIRLQTTISKPKTNTATDDSADDSAAEIEAFDVSEELIRFQTVVSKPWDAIWREAPLVFCDSFLCPTGDRSGLSQSELKDAVASILLNHKGVVSYFRIDSSRSLNLQTLETWFNILSEKKVKEMVLFNCSGPQKLIEFPMDSLDGSQVEVLRICFFRIPEVYAFDLSKLHLLDFSYCKFDTEHLLHFVEACPNIRELHLGYYDGNVRIRSDKLEIFQVWCSTMKSVNIEHAPELRKLTIAASPGKYSSSLSVRVINSLYLEHITCNISNQWITINGSNIQTDDKVLLNVRKLYIGLSMSKRRQREQLSNILNCLTHLEDLSIWRMDTVANNEDYDAALEDWSPKLRVKTCLKSLQICKMEGYQGGKLESDFASAVVVRANRLKRLIIESDKEDVFKKAVGILQKVKWTSPDVSVERRLNPLTTEASQEKLPLEAKLIRQVANDVFNSKFGWNAGTRRLGA